MNRTINGKLDEFGFMYLETTIINPMNNLSVVGAKSIIDTGAAYSHINPSLANELGLKAVDSTEYINPIDGNIKSPIYNIKLEINDFTIPVLKVRTISQPDYPSALIIGIDLIKHCDLKYNCSNKTFELILLPNVSVQE